MRARKKHAIGQRWTAAIILVMHRPSVLGEQAVLHAQRLSDQVSDNRHGRRRTPADIHGRSVPGQACCDAGSPGRYLASGRRGQWFGSRRSSTTIRAWPLDVCRCDPLPNSALLDQGGAAARRRWPGVSAALCLGRPARRTPGHSRKIRQISRAHSRRRPGACSRPVLLRPVPGRRYQEDGGTPGCSLTASAHSAARRVVRPFPTNPVGAKLAGRAPCPAEKRVHSSLKERAAQRASLGSHPCRSEVPLNGHWEARG